METRFWNKGKIQTKSLTVKKDWFWHREDIRNLIQAEDDTKEKYGLRLLKLLWKKFQTNMNPVFIRTQHRLYL